MNWGISRELAICILVGIFLHSDVKFPSPNELPHQQWRELFELLIIPVFRGERVASSHMEAKLFIRLLKSHAC